MAAKRNGTLSCFMRLPRARGLSLVALFAFALSTGWAKGPAPPHTAALSSAQVVSEMQNYIRAQRKELRQYRSLRTYRVEYHGYDRKIEATMKVAVSYDASQGESFRIVSQSGSAFLCNAVLKRAVQGEEEASKERAATALTPANYRFQLLGSQNLNGRPAYVLAVEPLKSGKFLYKGKIWVDASDFAVMKIRATPSRNPSFWIYGTRIRLTNELTKGFWLPEETESRTRVRIGGRADLTIDYGAYQIAPAARTARIMPLPSPVPKLAPTRPEREAAEQSPCLSGAKSCHTSQTSADPAASLQ